MRNYIVLALIGILASCQPSSKEKIIEEEIESPAKLSRHSENIDKIFKAHGGFDVWSEMEQLSFNKGDERHLTNLKDRRSIITSPNRTIGFDGQDVWITPDSAKVDGARFYHNLFFYFYAMPFVFGDPGIFYEDVAERDILGKHYSGVKISYDGGVGDSPKDNYILWYDKGTSRMEWLMYTVTFKSGEVSQKYNLIKYDRWEDFKGLNLPSTIQWYQFKNDTIGEIRNEVVFEDITISKERPSMDLFAKPEGALIAPPPSTE